MVVALLAAGCDSAPTQGQCEAALSETVASLDVDGLDTRFPDVTFRVIAGDNDVADAASVVVDLAPVSRGEHRALHVQRDDACRITTTQLPAALPSPVDLPTITRVGLDVPPQPGLGGLMVTGSDTVRAKADDTSAWGEVFRALRVGVPHLHAPSRAETLTAIADTCTNVGPLGTVVLVTSGRATPAGGGALILGHEAVTYRALADTVATHCADAGGVVWVIDAGYAGDLDITALGDAPPLLLWRASSVEAPDAARRGVDRGGALSAALGQVVTQRAKDRCLDAFRAQPAEIAEIFTVRDVRATLVAARWEAIGAPALANTPGDGDPTPQRAILLGRLLDAQIPAEAGLVTASGQPASATRCAQDSDCVSLTAACTLASCHLYRCEVGQCLLRVALDTACDDGSPCTQADRCAATGQCEGQQVPCADTDPCTTDLCDPLLGCVFPPASAGVSCDDGDACTEADRCDGLGGCGGAAVRCEDADPCTLDRCDSGTGCVFPQATVACDDGNRCTRSDTCRSGICEGSPVSCDDGNPCTADACDPDSGACRSIALAEGAPCDDFDACTRADRCLEGACNGIAQVCDDGLSCTFDACEGGVCAPIPIPGFCVVDGACVPVGSRPASQPCVICAATGRLEADPTQTGQVCDDDGVACTSDRCDGGVCRHAQDTGTCTRADGTCVNVGDPIGACLWCAATGVGEPVAAGASCGEDRLCSDAACDGEGVCVPQGAPCCVEDALTCDTPWSGDTLGGATATTTWSCDPAELAGPERTVTFEAPCDGVVSLALTANDDVAVLVHDDLAQCQAGGCSASFVERTLSMVQGQVLTLTVDGDGPSPFVLRAGCACTEPRP